jgi:hypothetical protein
MKASLSKEAFKQLFTSYFLGGNGIYSIVFTMFCPSGEIIYSIKSFTAPVASPFVKQ